MGHRYNRLQKNLSLPKLANNRGAALVIVLFLMVIFLFLSDIFVLRSIHERNMATVERETAKALYAAQGGAQTGLDGLDNLINNFLNNTIASSNPSSVIGFTTGRVNAGDGIGWLAYSVRNNNVPVLTQNGDQAEYSANGAVGDNTYQYKIVIMEKNDPTAVSTDIWDFPYNYRIESAGTAGTMSGEVLVSGDFTVRVQRDNFAKYSLFTNDQTTQSGSYVWFTNKTYFAGPVHTNARFNFALNPSGTFDNQIRQRDQLARFYNNGSPVSLDANYNGVRDVPVFNDTFSRNVSAVTLSSPTQQTDMENQAKGGQTFSSNGIYVPNSGGSLTGGIYVRGNATVNMSVDGSNNAVYTVNQSGTTKMITVNRTNKTTTVVGTQTNTYNGAPDGVDGVGTLIYSTGSITGLGGTVQRDTQMTIASASDMVITNNVVYQEYTPGSGTPGISGYVPPTADGTTNLLGLVSWAGNVRIGTSAPDNISVHSTILARQGVFQVDDYNSGSPRGTATLLGGVITDDYGAFGTFNGSTGQQVSGYGRNFVYDQRMEVGNAPPYFPSLNTFIAFTNGIADKLVWQEGGTW
ncbi:MAG: DUF4900 domain-containing protein [Candidatus Omnitrophica bacterium]|nr:DUF4900 domain-containing protein [Candidatus Omnitrophota bacterium]